MITLCDNVVRQRCHAQPQSHDGACPRWLLCRSQRLCDPPNAEKSKGKGKGGKAAERRLEDDPALSPGFLPAKTGKGEPVNLQQDYLLIVPVLWRCRMFKRSWRLGFRLGGWAARNKPLAKHLLGLALATIILAS